MDDVIESFTGTAHLHTIGLRSTPVTGHPETAAEYRVDRQDDQGVPWNQKGGQVGSFTGKFPFQDLTHGHSQVQQNGRAGREGAVELARCCQVPPRMDGAWDAD